ncbi:MAG: hypothetical protein AB7O56_02005 [Bauldia sp.]
MPTVPRILRALAIGAGLVLTAVGSAAAQPQPNIAVPTPTPSPGYGFEGCYMIQQPLYGNYFVSFCLQGFGRGNYGVTGNISCSGQITWNQYQAQANIQLQYTTCTGRMSWSADKMTCYLQPGYQPYVGPGVDPRVAIPTPTPTNPGLQCTYQPSVPGYPATTVYPQRVYY